MQLPAFTFTLELEDIEKVTIANRYSFDHYQKFTLIHYYQRRAELSDAISYYKGLNGEEDFLLERAAAIAALTLKRDLCQRCIYDLKDREAKRPPEPIFVARKDNQLEMDILKNVFGRTSLEEAFRPEGKGMEAILEKLELEKRRIH